MTKPLIQVTLLRVKAGGKLVYKAAWWGLKDGHRRRLTETIGPVSTTRRKDAKLACAQKQAAMNEGRVTSDRLGRVSLAAFLENDRRNAALDLKATSLLELAKAGEYAESVLGADFNVHRVDAAAVARIRQHLQTRDLAPATVLKHLTYLQGAFRRGVEAGLLHANPFAKMRRPRFQTPRPKTFRPEETDAMLGVCRDASDLWWETFIMLALTSGMRRGEIEHLLWSSVDFDQSTVTVNPAKSGEFTVGDQTYRMLAWESKDYQTRTLPIPTETLDLLRRLKAKAGASPYVFITLDRLAVIRQRLDSGRLEANYKTIGNINYAFSVIQRQASDRLSRQAGGTKIEWPRRSIKHLRSTYASRVSEHVSAFQLKDLLGHSSVTTTQRHYVAAGDDLGRKVAAAFGQGRKAVEQQ